MPHWLVVLILGVIEGITELLPVSSTGHLLIAEHWLPRQSDMFNIVIQTGAVLAVLPLFPERVRQLLNCWRDDQGRDYAAKLITAFVITGIGGLALDRLGFKLPEAILPIAVALLVGGILFIVVERRLKNQPRVDAVSWAMAVAVGVGQLLAAVFPGTSRSGATILLMLLLGCSRPLAAEFSFLVGIPTMVAAGGLKIFDALRHPVVGAPPEQWGFVVFGTVISAVVSFLAVRWLLRYVQTHTFEGFGWYRVAIGLVLLLAFWR